MHHPAPDCAGTVHVVDDDETIRGTLASLFRSMGLQVRDFASAEGFLEAGRAAGPSCLVLDVRLRGESGLSLLQSLPAQPGGPIPVVMMTGHGDVSMTVRAMKAGARDFLEKPFRDQDMIDAVMDALRADERRRAADRLLEEQRACWATLTPREKEVLGHVAAGRLNKQIAGEIGTSEITVKIHRGQGMRKMRSRSVAELVLKMQALGVIAPTA
jgi:FixJ family two-component response regulator